MMDNEIYSRIYKNSNESPDGESPSKIVVTKESNGYAVWEDTYESLDLIKYFHNLYDRESALEKGVTLYLERKGGK